MKKVKTPVCLFIFLICFYSLNNAQDVRLNTGTEMGESILPRIDMNTSGNAVTCWMNYDFDTEMGQISMLYVTKKGQPEAALFEPVDPGWGNNHLSPDVAIKENGHFIVVWDENFDTYEAIYGRMFYKNQSPKEDPFLIVQSQAGDKVSSPRIAMNQSGDFAVCWYSKRDGYSKEIYGRLFDQDGIAKGDPFHVNDDTTGSQLYPVIDMNATGRFVIAWYDEQNGLPDIYAQRYDESGIAQGTNFEVSQHPDQTEYVSLPSIAVQENGDFMITWVYTDDADIYHVYASLFDQEGFPKTSMTIVDHPPDTDRYLDTDVITNPNGGYIITFSKYYDVDHWWRTIIHAREYNEAGNPLDNVYRVGEEVAHQYNSCVGVDAIGNKVFLWRDTRDVDRFNIYATTNLARKPHLVSAGTGFQDLIPISWTLPYGSDDNIPYKIYRSTNPAGPFTELSEIDIPSRPYPKLMLDYIDETVEPGLDYYYQVEAVTEESGGPSETLHGTASSSGYLLDSKWMQQQPVLDGEIQDSEWSDAAKIDIGNPNANYPVWLYIKNSQDTLYMAVKDENDDNMELFNCLGFILDANHNQKWDADPKEGAFRIYDSAIYFTAYTGNYPATFHSGVPVLSTDIRGSVSLTDNQLHYEATVPHSDGLLTAEPGDTLWMAFWVEDPGSDYGLFYGNAGEWPPNALWEATETLGHIILAEEPLVGVSQKPVNTSPNQFELFQNFPNPFNPITTISYRLPKSSQVRISIYDVNGKMVETLINEIKPAGFHSIEWRADRVSSGIYFYRLETAGYLLVKKLVVMK